MMIDMYDGRGAANNRKVVIAGARGAGRAAATYLVERGFRATLPEKRHVAGGTAPSWRDADGDWPESGLHVFFGAYRNLLASRRETGLSDTFAWVPHAPTFSQPGRARSPFITPARLPTPFNGLTSIARNSGVLTNPGEAHEPCIGIISSQTYARRPFYYRNETLEQERKPNGLTRVES